MFYVGQRIVAVKSHSQGVFKKGDEFILKAITQRPCGCSGLYLDIGIRSGRRIGACNKCGNVYESMEWWFCESSFSPLDYTEEEINEVNINELIEELELV